MTIDKKFWDITETEKKQLKKDAFYVSREDYGLKVVFAGLVDSKMVIKKLIFDRYSSLEYSEIIRNIELYDVFDNFEDVIKHILDNKPNSKKSFLDSLLGKFENHKPKEYFGDCY